MGLGRSSSLRIGGDSLVVAGSGRTRGTFNRSAAVETSLRRLLFPWTRVRRE